MSRVHSALLLPLQSHKAVHRHLTPQGYCCKDKAMEHVLGSQEMQSTAAQVLGLGIEARHSYTGKPSGLLLLLAKFILQRCASKSD